MNQRRSCPSLVCDGSRLLDGMPRLLLCANQPRGLMSAFLVYLVCFGVGLLFTICTALFGHIFGGHDTHVDGSGGHAEAGVDGSDTPGVSALSPTVIASFVTAFGGIGMILH